jgi:hypothetical protein
MSNLQRQKFGKTQADEENASEQTPTTSRLSSRFNDRVHRGGWENPTVDDVIQNVIRIKRITS